MTACDTRIFTKECFDTIVEDFPGLWMYLSHVAAAKYKMPELNIKAPDLSAIAAEKTKGRTAASAAILSQMSRIEKVIGAMSKRLSNIEKVMLTPGTPSGASPNPRLMASPTTGPRRTSGSRSSGMNKFKKATRKLSASSALSGSASSPPSSPSNDGMVVRPPRNSFNKDEI